MQQIALWWFNKRLAWAIRKAVRLRLTSGKQVMVFYVKNKFKIYFRKELKNLIAEGKAFRKGTTIQDLDRLCYYKR